MPSTSKKQQKFMRAVANSPDFAKKVGVPRSVGDEFMKADKMKKMKYQAGGMAEYEVPKEKQGKMREQADTEEMDRKMKEAMEKHKKTRVGGGKKEMAMGGKVGSSCGTKKKMAMGGMTKAYAKGGKVRGCGMAKKGVRKPKMY
jgi:hypothetical protein